MIWCYCGARFDPSKERHIAYAWYMWWHHHGGPVRRCLYWERIGFVYGFENTR